MVGARVSILIANGESAMNNHVLIPKEHIVAICSISKPASGLGSPQNACPLCCDINVWHRVWVEGDGMKFSLLFGENFATWQQWLQGSSLRPPGRSCFCRARAGKRIGRSNERA